MLILTTLTQLPNNSFSHYKSDKNAEALSKNSGSFFGYRIQMRTHCFTISCKSLYFGAAVSLVFCFYYITILLFYNSTILHSKLKEKRKMSWYKQSLHVLMSIEAFPSSYTIILSSYFPCKETDDIMMISWWWRRRRRWRWWWWSGIITCSLRTGSCLSTSARDVVTRRNFLAPLHQTPSGRIACSSPLALDSKVSLLAVGFWQVLVFFPCFHLPSIPGISSYINLHSIILLIFLRKIHRSFHSVADLNGFCRLLQIYNIAAPKKLNTKTVKTNTQTRP